MPTSHYILTKESGIYNLTSATNPVAAQKDADFHRRVGHEVVMTGTFEHDCPAQLQDIFAHTTRVIAAANAGGSFNNSAPEEALRA